ncbi:site-2 protease family protein [Streptomyces sparsus]
MGTERTLHRISPVFLTLAAVTAVAGWAVWQDVPPMTGLWVFLFVLAGWVVSLCLHEYAHARTALHSGDTSVAEKGYLTLNPMRYTHALLSVVLPVLFVVMGGIGLPGGAVFIERGRIRGRLRHSLISAAGPLTNAALAVALTAPFWLGALDGVPSAFRFALAFLAMLQVTAAVLNSLPVPGLDGYAAVEPWLTQQTRDRLAPFAPYGLLAVFGCLWIPEVNQFFWQGVYEVMGGLSVPGADVYRGLEFFRFWQGEPAVSGR